MTSENNRIEPPDAALDAARRTAADEAVCDDLLVDEMSDESFPGSDPPSTWAGPDHPPSPA